MANGIYTHQESEQGLLTPQPKKRNIDSNGGTKSPAPKVSQPVIKHAKASAGKPMA